MNDKAKKELRELVKDLNEAIELATKKAYALSETAAEVGLGELEEDTHMFGGQLETFGFDLDDYLKGE